MTLTPLPPAPNPSDPATFNDRTGAFVAALPTMVTEFNNLLFLSGTALRHPRSGTANAIVLTTGSDLEFDPPTGYMVRFRATSANTGATTIKLDTGPAKSCLTITGVALPAGYIRTDLDTVAVYNGINWIVHREIERGSNANGEYERGADGSVRMTGNVETVNVTTALGSLWSSAITTFTHPVEATVILEGSVAALGSEQNWGTVRPVSGTVSNWRAFRPSSAASQTFRVKVAGKWY